MPGIRRRSAVAWVSSDSICHSSSSSSSHRLPSSLHLSGPSAEPCTPSVLFPRPCLPPLWDSTCGTWPWAWDEARTSWEETLPTVLSSRLKNASISSSAAGASKRSWTDRLREKGTSSGRAQIFPCFSTGSCIVISTSFYFIRNGSVIW